MRFYHVRNWIVTQLALRVRLQAVCFWYVVSLLVEARKHSLTFAASLSGLQKSQFSKFLRNHCGVTAYALEELSKRQAKRFAPVLKQLEGLPWKIAVVIDATLQGRAGLHTENAKRFNHGHGTVIGHQWTNIVLMLNGILIPLPPIPFYSKNYCKAYDLVYASEHDRLVDYLNALNLTRYVGFHQTGDIIVLMDSGYDVKKLQRTIRTRGWHFLGALKARRSVKSPVQHAKTTSSTGWTGIAKFFKDHRRLAWQTICLSANRGTQKRMEVRVRQTTGYLKGVGAVQLVCSEYKRRRTGRRKYLACSDLDATPEQIVCGYRLRWKIEIFHKEVKQYLGFEDVAPKYFSSVESHVSLVYCAYILLHMDMPGIPDKAATILEKQAAVKRMLEKRRAARILQILTQFGGVETYKEELKAALAA